MELNLAEEKGVLYDGEVFLTENHFYIKGDRVEQTEPYNYTIENAYATTCDGENPDWRVTGKNLDVTINGYGIVKHGTLWVKNVPVFYMPWFIFPVKLDRQSGLLIPEIGLSSRKGFIFDQPLYWVINDNSDMTFYDQYMTKRGHKLGVEFRYVLDPQSKLTFMADFLDDGKTDDGTEASTDDWGYKHDVWDRTNTDRYWVRMKQDHSLGHGVSMKLDLDIVSDQDYLIEFRGGYTGFENTRDYFLNSFNRTIDGYEDTTRTNRLNLNKRGDIYSLNMDLKWYDDVIARRLLDEDRTLQKLPHLSLNTLKQQIYDSPFYWHMMSEYTYFYSEDGTNGHRMDVYPKLYLPFYRNPYITLEPSVGLRQTVWRTEKFENNPLEMDKDKTEFRHQYDLKLDLKSEIYKVYPWNKGGIKAIRHTLVPQLVYEYSPHNDQDDLPWYNGLDDGINRIESANRISFNLTQFLTTRSLEIRDSSKGKNQDSKPVDTYHQFLRFELKQGYDIDEARKDNSLEYRNGREKQPFLPLDAELELICNDFFSIWADAKWCHYDNKFLTHNIELQWQDNRGNQLHLDYRYTDEFLEALNADGCVAITDTLSAYAGYKKNLHENKSQEKTIGIVFDSQCWAMDVRVKEDDDDKKIEFMINFKGLGEIGNN